MSDDGLTPTEPDCPACGTRCVSDRERPAWVCRHCDLTVIG